jgi:hypothetical protein
MRITAVDQDPVVVARAARRVPVVAGDPRCSGERHPAAVRRSKLRLRDLDAAALLRPGRGGRGPRRLAASATRAVVVADVRRHWFLCAATALLGSISRNSLFRAAHGDRSDVVLGRLGGQAGFARMRVRRHAPFRRSLVGLL